MRSQPDLPSKKSVSRRSQPKGGGVVFSHFVTCAPGLEPVLHAELAALKLAKVERQVGGVYFEGSAEAAMRVNLESRVAVRVLRRVTRFMAETSDALYEGAHSIEWSRYLRPGASLLVASQTKESALDHSLFVEQRVKDAICDEQRSARGERPEVDKDNPDLRVNVHLFRDRCTLSVDTSGESLHKRGWRQFQGGAPLAETLAAGLILMSGWDRRSPLLDPFCGSATILVEAAHMAANYAPGLSRKFFGFEAFPDHDVARWKKLRAEAEARVRVPSKLQLLGSDEDASVIEGARANLAAAGLTERVQLDIARAEDFAPRAGWNGWILTNPPYGERIGNVRELGPLYRRFAAQLRAHCKGYHLALFSGNPDLDALMKFEFASRTPLANGAIACELLQIDL